MSGYWHPVYKSGCGWDRCPECGPLIELEKQAMHEDARNRTLPKFRDDWSAEMFANAQAREPSLLAERKAARRKAYASRAKAREVIRVRRPLTPRQEAIALRYLTKCRIRREFLVDGRRDEWLSRVWLELVNPTIAAARRRSGRWTILRDNSKKAFRIRILRAIYRAQKAMRNEHLQASKNISAQTVYNI